MPDPFHSEGLQQVEQHTAAAAAGGRGAQRGSSSTGGSSRGASSAAGSRSMAGSSAAAAGLGAGDRPGFDEYRRVVNTAFEVGEHALVRDVSTTTTKHTSPLISPPSCSVLALPSSTASLCWFSPLKLTSPCVRVCLSIILYAIRSLSLSLSLSVSLSQMVYVLQGIDGKYVKYSRRADGFIVDASAGVPRATRHLCHTLSELGWLFLRVQRFVTEGLDNPQTGRGANRSGIHDAICAHCGLCP